MRAARLFGAAETQWQASASRRYAPDQPGHERDVARVRAQLDERLIAAEWAAAQAMNAQQAIVYAPQETRAEL